MNRIPTFILLLIALFVQCNAGAQSKLDAFLTPSDSVNQCRLNTVCITETALLGSTLVGLHQVWYKEYPKSAFHFKNDNNDWLQLDKIGHLYSTYHIGRFGAETLAWAGANKKQQFMFGATLGFAFMTTVEVFDGFSREWGASWGDVIANASGAGLYVVQKLLWEEQRIIPKFSFHRTRFAKLRPETLGNGFNEELLKDYNGQTYWLSANLYDFTKATCIPKWVNVAFGYGADGMLYGSRDTSAPIPIGNIHRTRQFYLSLDVDLTKINTNSHFLKTIFSAFNTIKLPAPTLELTDFGGLKGYFIYF